VLIGAVRATQERFPLFQVFALAVAFTYGALSLPGLASWEGIRAILCIAALAGLASIGQTLLILMGGFDLSISGFIVASSLIVTNLHTQWGVSFFVGLLIAVGGVSFMGGLAGYICHRFKIQPLIVTLAMGTIAAGLVQADIGESLQGAAPSWLTKICATTATTFGVGIPPLIVIWVVAIIGVGLFLSCTVIGRRLMATGANQRAADFALIRTRRIWTATFAVSGALSALAGLLIAGFAGSVDPTIGDPYLFQSVVAVIVGGTLFGGPGDYTRTVIGVLFMTTLTTVIVGHGATPSDEDIVYGVAILGAVALYGRQRRIGDRV
jgi:ribose transport system permease protein